VPPDSNRAVASSESLAGTGPAGARPRERDPVLGSTHKGAAVVFVLAIANGGFLYFFPARAKPDYAWAIAPPVSAAFMGAGYLAGFVAAGLTLRARHWRSMHSLVWPLAILSLGLLCATLIHAERFRWGHPPAWGWTIIYAVIPPGAAYLWLRQTRVASPPPPADPRLRWPRRLSWPLGAAFVLLGLVLVVTPGSLVDEWPWHLTPLLGRAFGSWYLLMGTLLLFAAATIARPHEVPIPYATVATWSVLTLLLPLLYGDTVGSAGGRLALGVAVHALAFVLSVAALAYGLVLMRRDAEPL
jgi:hypothetical protein